MRRCTAVVVFAVFAVACGGPRVNVAQERERLMQVDRQWAENTRDLDKFVSYYAADATVYPPEMPMATGTAAIHDVFTKLTAAPGFSLRFAPNKADVAASGDLGYTSGTYQTTANDAAGQPMTDRGKYVAVWKKTGNDWKAVADIFNSDLPPAAAAPAPTPTRTTARPTRPTRATRATRGQTPRRRR